MAKNRFLNSRQLTEEQFIGIVFDYCFGVTSIACAERIGVSDRRVRERFSQLRQRVATDSTIGGIIVDRFPADHPVWSGLQDCIMKCSAAYHLTEQDDTEFDAYSLNYFVSRERINKQGIQIKIRSANVVCTKCPVKGKFDSNNFVSGLIHFQNSFQYGLGSAEFREYFIECCVRAKIHSASQGFTYIDFVRDILQSCESKKL